LYHSLLHYAKLAVNGQGILVWEELSVDATSGDPRQPFLQAIKAAFEVSSSSGTYPSHSLDIQQK